MKMTENKYKLDVMLRYFFPIVWSISFLIILYRRIFICANFGISGIHDVLLFLLELFIQYHMLRFLSLEYKLDDEKLIERSFIIKKKIYYFKDFVQIREEGSFFIFQKMPFGINGIIIDLKNGKQFGIIGLKDHFDFLQRLRQI
jgi:hypothetical protein